MAVDKWKNFDLTRRDALRGLAMAPFGVAATSWLAGCADDGHYDALDEHAPAPQQIGRIDAGRSSADAGAATRDASSPLVSPTTNGGWAVGGTKAMVNPDAYPDPFGSSDAGNACVLYPAMTLGPCYAQGPAKRRDVTDGVPGLPLRLSFLVVRATGGCAPVPEAEVDIWHTSASGVYSTFASGICNPNRAPQPGTKYCRGTQTTDANGRCDFHTVFPGHYPGRSIHIHFTVRVGGRAYSTSQLFFDDALSDEIMATAEYTGRGRRNTTNKNDNILRGVDLTKVVMGTAKRDEGALHAWKVLAIRS